MGERGVGFYDGTSYTSYIKANGTFGFIGASGAGGNSYLVWDGTTMKVRGVLNADDMVAGTLHSQSWVSGSPTTSGVAWDLNTGELNICGSGAPSYLRYNPATKALDIKANITMASGSYLKWADIAPGSGKAADYATVGADETNLKVGVSSNLIIDADHSNWTNHGLAFWESMPGALGTTYGTQYSSGYVLPPPNITPYIKHPTNTPPTTAYSAFYTEYYAVVANSWYELYAYTGARGCKVQLTLAEYNGLGGYITSTTLSIINDNEMPGGYLLSNYKKTGGFFKTNVATASIYITVAKFCTYSTSTESYLHLGPMYLGKALTGQAAAGVFSDWSPGPAGYTGQLKATVGATSGLNLENAAGDTIGDQDILNTMASYTAISAWNFSNSAEGWVFGNGSATLNLEYITLTSSGLDPIFTSPTLSINGSLYPKIRARIRRTAGSIGNWDGKIFYSTSGHGIVATYYQQMTNIASSNTWYVIEANMTSVIGGGPTNDWVTNTITSIRLDLGNQPGDVFDVDWVAIGTTVPSLWTSNTYIDASGVYTGTVVANKVTTGTLNSSIIYAGTITANQITAGTIDSKLITLSATGGECAIRAGKTDFGAGSGFILGVDFNDGQKAKFEVGNNSQGLKWDGANLSVSGNINLTTGSIIMGTPATTVVSNAATGVVLANQALVNASGAALTAKWTGITEVPYVDILNNDAATTLGFNPSFEDWPVGQTYPSGWVIWNGQAPVKETSIVRYGHNAVKFAPIGNAAEGMMSCVMFDIPMDGNTIIAGTVDVNLLSYASGTCGIKVRVYLNAASSLYTDTDVKIPSYTLNKWQRIPFVARSWPAGNAKTAAPIYGIRFFIMAAWNGPGWPEGFLRGSVVFDGFAFGFFHGSIDNQSISLTKPTGTSYRLNGGDSGLADISCAGLGITEGADRTAAALNTIITNVRGGLELGLNGWIKSASKNADGSGNGLLYGVNGFGTALFNVGDGAHGSTTNHISWNGTELEVRGKITAEDIWAGTIQAGRLTVGDLSAGIINQNAISTGKIAAEAATKPISLAANTTAVSLAGVGIWTINSITLSAADVLDVAKFYFIAEVTCEGNAEAWIENPSGVKISYIHNFGGNFLYWNTPGSTSIVAFQASPQSGTYSIKGRRATDQGSTFNSFAFMGIFGSRR
jgi:hypothetical protein